MNIFQDKTEMPKQPDLSVSAVRIPGEDLAGATRDMRMPGQVKWPLDTTHVARPRYGHKV